MTSNNIYNKLQHFDIDVNVQVDNGNTKIKQIQRTPNIRKSQNIQTNGIEISSPSKLFHDTPFACFPGTCVSKKFYNNLISKSKSHFKFTGTLFFYALFLCLAFRNYFLSPKLNHGFSS